MPATSRLSRRPAARSSAGYASGRDGGETEFERLYALYGNQEDFFDGPGEFAMESGFGGASVSTQAEDDAFAVRFDRVKGGTKQPDDQDRNNKKQEPFAVLPDILADGYLILIVIIVHLQLPILYEWAFT